MIKNDNRSTNYVRILYRNQLYNIELKGFENR